MTASYGIGAAYYRLSPGEPELLWESDDVMSSQYPTPVEHEGKLYGMHGRDDAGPADLRCIDPMTQKVLWSESGFGMATIILADGKLILQKTDGTLVLARAASDKFTKLAEFELMNSTVRALPALANGKFYVRDETTLKCVQLGLE